MKIKWLGHAGFKIDNIMIDPWIERIDSLQMDAPYTLKDEDRLIKGIVITHNHEDHFTGSWNLAKEQDATVIGTPESVMPAAMLGIKNEMMNMGGPLHVAGWNVRLVPAMHTGFPTGVILEKNGMVVYHSGDTGLFGDMKLIGQLYKPDIALLPIGGRFTMNEDDAAIAAEMIGAKHVIPMHYNTFPLINADPQHFKKLVESKGKSKVHVLSIGQEIELHKTD
jgi:L-ascorbate metabolism protein UlaG (beta-lactamase superfamily)